MGGALGLRPSSVRSRSRRSRSRRRALRLRSPTRPSLRLRPRAPGPATTGIGSGKGTATVPPPAIAADTVALTGSWVADNGDVLEFVETTPGTYRGTVIVASHCAAPLAAVVVTSQGYGRFTGTGPLGSARAGWCGPPSPLASVTIQVGTGGSTALVSGDPTAAVEAWTRTTFAVSGQIAPPGPNDEDEAEGSPALAKTCDRKVFNHDEGDGSSIATSFQFAHATAASQLLSHFLDGSGTPIGFPSGSPTASEAAQSDAFLQEDQRIRSYLASRLDQGQTRIALDQGQGVLGTVDFTSHSVPDLYLGFRATQALDVSGVGAVIGADYVGELTYVIQDVYGFGVHDYLFGAARGDAVPPDHMRALPPGRRPLVSRLDHRHGCVSVASGAPDLIGPAPGPAGARAGRRKSS